MQEHAAIDENFFFRKRANGKKISSRIHVDMTRNCIVLKNITDEIYRLDKAGVFVQIDF